MENFDYIENWSVVARQLFGLSNEWKVYRIAYCDKGDGYLEPTVELGVAVTKGVYKSGPRKGQTKYSKTERRTLRILTSVFSKMLMFSEELKQKLLKQNSTDDLEKTHTCPKCGNLTEDSYDDKGNPDWICAYCLLKAVDARQALEKRILELVKRETGTTTIRIVSKLRTENPRLSESMASQAVWALVDNGMLALTDDCGLTRNSKKN